MAREAICTRDKDGLNSANVGVKDSTRDLSSHVYVESWRDRVRVPQYDMSPLYKLQLKSWSSGEAELTLFTVGRDKKRSR